MKKKEYIERGPVLERNMRGNTAPITHRTYAERLISSAPAADVVEVVRCKDCKHENVHHAISDKCTWCDYWGIDPDFDDFCSYGERRDNDATD